MPFYDFPTLIDLYFNFFSKQLLDMARESRREKGGGDERAALA